MQEAREILADLCDQISLPQDGLDDLTLTGQDPVLPSSFRIGTIAQTSIALSALAAAEFWYQRQMKRGGKRQAISVDMRHAAVEFRSDRYLRDRKSVV